MFVNTYGRLIKKTMRNCNLIIILLLLYYILILLPTNINYLPFFMIYFIYRFRTDENAKMSRPRARQRSKIITEHRLEHI